MSKDRIPASGSIIGVMTHLHAAFLSAIVLLAGALSAAQQPPAVAPLTAAVWSGHPEQVAKLLSEGADPTAVDQSTFQSWEWAILARDSASLALLLPRVPKLDAGNRRSDSMLHVAAVYDDVPLIQSLIALGVPVDAAAIDRSTPLLLAAESGYAQAVAVLLAHGAAPDAPDQHGDTPLMGAVRIGSIDTVRQLLKAGASPNTRDAEGRTALMWARRGGNDTVTKALIAAGADRTLTDQAGRTAEAYAPRKTPLASSPRAAVEKAIPLLQDGAEQWSARQRCLACHHHPLITRVTARARSKGIAFDVKKEAAIWTRMATQQQTRRPRVQEALAGGAEAVLQLSLQRSGDPAFATAWFLGSAAEAGKPPTADIASDVELEARLQLPDGSWHGGPPRVPIESNPITTTAMAVRAIQAYAESPASAENVARIGRARSWLLRAEGRAIDDLAFRLLGLKWTGADTKAVAAAAAALQARQQPDGGWAQLPGANSDAYATGLALVALRAATGSAGDAAYRKGVRYLLLTQEADGSWLVSKRGRPLNEYFESGFPHGKFQFISFAATCWASLALMDAL
jgi:ankyrin repeat protein